jgi:hypothetical protein
MQAPDVMRSCCAALSLVTTALGGYASAGLLVAVQANTTWLNDLMHGSRLDLYFLVLAAVMLLNTAVFVIVAMRYKYKEIQHRTPLPTIGGQHAQPQWRPQPVAGVQSVPGASRAIPIHVRPGYGYQYFGTPSTPDVGPYGRSVTYMPQTPAMPAHFR